MKRGAVLAVFARYPEAGKVKTRLAAHLGHEEACRIYESMLRSLLLEHGNRSYDLVAFVAPGDRSEAFARRFGGETEPQSDGDLGGRMEDCFRRLLDRYDRVAIVGSDIPGAVSDRAAEAFRRCDQSDVVLGPCPDGGYYLIASRSVPDVFTGVRWSTPEVLSTTLHRLRETGRTWSLLPEERDVDEPEDLKILELRISAIVPVVDGDGLPEGVAGVFNECIVVDGGGEGRGDRRSHHGEILIRSPRGRALQMNAGAEAATGDVFLFLHADSRLPAGAADRIRAAVRRGAPGGCFETVFDHNHPVLRVGDFWRNLRARLLGEFYGDQSIFVRRDVFRKLGGYRRLEVMEDYDLCRRMARFGKPAFIPGRAVTSARKFLRHGLVRTWLGHQRLKLRHLLSQRPRSLL